MSSPLQDVSPQKYGDQSKFNAGGNIPSSASDNKSRIKTPFKSVSPKRPSAAEPSQRSFSVSPSPENRMKTMEETKG